MSVLRSGIRLQDIDIRPLAQRTDVSRHKFRDDSDENSVPAVARSHREVSELVDCVHQPPILRHGHLSINIYTRRAHGIDPPPKAVGFYVELR